MTLLQAEALWRLWVNEPHPSIPDAPTVDLFLLRGLEALNRRVRYRVTDTTIALVSGQQEYLVDPNLVEIFWIELNGALLKKGDWEQWRQKGVNWRNDAGTPREWFLYGRQLVVYPKPDAQTGTPNLTLRALSSPTQASDAEFAFIEAQDQELPVRYAASLWYCTPNGRLSGGSEFGMPLMKSFEDEAKAAEASYAARRLMK